MAFNLRQGIYLAALLHDIGKFWQRGVPSKKVLSSNTLNMRESICPTNKHNRPTHIHALFTSEFFETFSKIFPGEIDHEDEKIQLGNLSARHHKYNLNEYEKIIKFADRLSSGHDRREDTDEDQQSSSYQYKKIPLLNPFDVIYETRKAENRSYFPFTPLDTNDSIFAQCNVDITQSREEDYKKQWEKFIAEIEQLPTGSFNALSHSLQSLLRKYTWCIPSSTNDLPDVSLYDHLKTTAAIATCLYDSQQIEKFGPLPVFDQLKQEDKERFMLLAGDFSGIQK